MNNREEYLAFRHAVSVPRITEEIEGAPYTYRVWGKSERLIVCLPGWSASSLMYGPFAAEVGHEYTVVSLDFPGWAGAAQPSQPLKTMDDYVSYVNKFISTKIRVPYAMLGYSFGSVVAEYCGDSIENKPGALILMSPLRGGNRIILDPIFGSGILLSKFLYELGFSLKKLQKIAVFAFGRYFKRAAYGEMLKESSFGEEMYQEMLACDPRTTFYSGSAVIGTDTLADEDESVKTWVFYGSDDFWFIKKDAKDIAKLAGTKAVVATNADHFHFLVQPEKSVPYIRTILASIWSPS